MASGVFTIALLFLTHVLGLNPPLWASVGGMLLYCVPVLAPDVVLFSPEPQMWYRGFYVACGIWALGRRGAAAPPHRPVPAGLAGCELLSSLR